MIRWIGRLIWLIFFYIGVWCVQSGLIYLFDWKQSLHFEGIEIVPGILLVAATLLLVPRIWPAIIPGFRKPGSYRGARIIWYIWWVLLVIFLLLAAYILFALLSLAYEHSVLPAIFGGYYGYQ